MTREEIIKEYEAAVAAHAAAAAAGIKGAEKSYELFKAGLDALRPVSREQVEKVWRGEWVYDKDGYLICSNCGFHPTYSQNSKDKKGFSNCRFCPNCGDAKTDEAVQMVMERVEALHDNRT